MQRKGNQLASWFEYNGETYHATGAYVTRIADHARLRVYRSAVGGVLYVDSLGGVVVSRPRRKRFTSASAALHQR